MATVVTVITAYL